MIVNPDPLYYIEQLSCKLEECISFLDLPQTYRDLISESYEFLRQSNEINSDLRMERIKNVSNEHLIRQWNEWKNDDSEDMKNHVFHYEEIHTELNRRGLGEICVV